jgi:hypothetical protein
MKGWMLVITAVSFFVFIPLSDGNAQSSPPQKPPLTNAATLELTFSGEESGNDFILVRPTGNCIAVDDKNNILVVDEDYVKIFNTAGKGIKRFGGKGQGPGEMIDARYIRMSPDGYISVFGGQNGYLVNYFKPDYSFITQMSFITNRNKFAVHTDPLNLILLRPEIVYCLNKNEQIYSVDAGHKGTSSTERKTDILLFFEKSDTLILVARYPQTNIVPVSGMGRVNAEWGSLRFCVLPQNRIAYIHTQVDTKIENNQYYYTITVLSLNNSKKQYITHHYTPTPIKWTSGVGLSEEIRVEVNKAGEKFTKERKFNASLISLIADKNLIFAYTLTTNDKSESLVDVFDGNTCSSIGSAYLPRFIDIKNGYGYKMNNFLADKDFAKLEKYRISPAVYGK